MLLECLEVSKLPALFLHGNSMSSPLLSEPLSIPHLVFLLPPSKKKKPTQCVNHCILNRNPKSALLMVMSSTHFQ